MKFWSQVTAIIWKDILSEIRTKESTSAVLVFTLLVIVIFNFAFSASQEITNLIAPGILWVTFTFAGVLSFNRSFFAEIEDGCIEGLLACPVSRDLVYLGKLLASLIFIFIVEAIALPIFAALFNLAVLSFPIITITFLTTIGFGAVGTLFSAMTVNTRAREMLLPILFLPIVSPIIIAAVKATGLALSGEPWGSLITWLEIIVAFDAIFLVVSFLVFAYVIEE